MKTRIMACVIAITIVASSFFVYASELPAYASDKFEITSSQLESSSEEEIYTCDIICSSAYLLNDDGRNLNGLQHGLQASNDRRSFALFDFTGYEAQLGAAEQITLSVQAAYSAENLISDIRFSLIDDSKEDKINSSLTYTQAVSDGIWSGGVTVGERTDTTAVKNITLDMDKEKITNALGSEDNKLIALRIERPSESGDNIILNPASLKLTLSYSSNCVNELAEGMQWSDVCEQNIDSVTNDIALPTQYKNCEISWHSSNELVVSLDGTVIRQPEDTTVILTATLKLGTKTASHEFEIIVPKLDSSSEDEIYNSDIIASSVYLLINDGRNLNGLQASNDRKSFALFDFTGYETPLSVAKKITISAKAAYTSENLISDIRFSVLEDSMEDKINSSLTYTQAVSDGMWEGGVTVGERTNKTALNSLTLDIDKEKLINALGSGDNNLIALRIDRPSDAGDNSVMESTAFKMTITYSSGCVDELAQGMHWSDIFEQSIDNVTSKLTLPSQYKICGVTWKSSDDSVISADGSVNRKAKDKTVTLTATLSLGKNSAERTFVVTVPKLEPSFVLNEINSTESWLRVKEIITVDYYDFFESTLIGSDYSKIKNTDSVFKGVVSNLPYTNFNELTAALADSVSRTYNAENKQSGSSRPSGGSKGTSGGSSVITTPIEIDKTSNDAATISFTDVTAEHWAYDAVSELSSIGTINGYEDNSFRPQANITRAEFIKMVSSLSDDVEKTNLDTQFTDVMPTDWYFTAVADAAAKKLINGADGYFMPYENISREDSVLIIYRLLSAKGTAPRGNRIFADRKDISEYAKQAVGAMGAAGIVDGNGDNMFLPKNKITRAEAAQLLYNALVK